MRLPVLASVAIVTSVCALTAPYAIGDRPADKDKQPSANSQATGTASAALRADADMQQVLTAFSELEPKAIEKLTPTEARKQPTPADAVNQVLQDKGQSTAPEKWVPGVTTADRQIPGPAGNLPATVYTPAGKGPFPVVVYFHGGGWVIADRKVYDGGARGLAKQAKAVVVSVDYRRAPEAKFPAAHDDALAAYKWVADNAQMLNGDPQRLALAGESAGGNLAVATAIAARDAKMTAPLHIVAVYPVAQTESTNTPSYVENSMGKPLNRPMIHWFLEHTLASPEQKSDTRLNLIRADLKGLPPVTIINASMDVLRSDGEKLESALRNAGVSVLRKNYVGVSHEFFGMAAVVQKAKDAQKLAGDRLNQAFTETAARDNPVK